MVQGCAGCGKSVRFEQEGSWARVCSFCQALVLRGGGVVHGTMERMPILEDLSPMRVGSIGTYGGQEFRITGRVRVESARGYRNFWSLKGHDLPYQWLAHAFGDHALLTAHDRAVTLEHLRGAKPTRNIKLDDGLPYIVEMLDNTFRYAWEGELMKPLPIPWAIEIELGRGPADKAIALVDGTKGIDCLSGVMVDFPELGLENASAWAQWT